MVAATTPDLLPDRDVATSTAPPAWPLVCPCRAKVTGVFNAHHEEVRGIPVASLDIASSSDS